MNADQDEPQMNADHADRARGGPAIRLDHVTKAFGDKTVLDDVSFDVAQGRAFCILGRSGTGKSVTLKHIVALLKPDRGKVIVDGADVTTLAPRELSRVRRRIGFVFQNAALFDSISVGENVAFPLRRHTDLADREIRARAREKLAQVGLEREYDQMPASLSGGMRKRAGLARAMALDPPMLLVDEPSAGLDPLTSDEIDDLLADLNRRERRTLVVVTHNMPSVRKLADEVVLLDHGKIVAHGSVEELGRIDEPLVKAFFHSSAGG
jgi:phospholipid/cholesterol/gamma-HCH transport system ATP-binding protein